MEDRQVSIVFTMYKNLLWVLWNMKTILHLNPSTAVYFVLIDGDSNPKTYLNRLMLRLFFLRKKYQGVTIRYNTNDGSLSGLSGSEQHGASLDAAAELVHTELAIVMDPDFVCMQNNWIRILLNFMQSQKFDVFGFPQARSSNNLHLQTGPGDYKYKTPLAFFLVGVKNSIFKFSFMPDKTTNNILDVGHRLSLACINQEIRFGLAESYNTRDSSCEIHFVNNYNCTFHMIPELWPDVTCLHYGRSSNPLAKRDSKVSIFWGVICSLLAPYQFRRQVTRYVTSLEK